jgi:hypothetical protein
MKTLLALAIVLALLATAGGAAMLVRGMIGRSSRASPLRRRCRAAERRIAGRSASRACLLRREDTASPRRSRCRSPPHGKRQPGDDSADELNRRQLRAE